jgi:hypothetical protein
MDDALITLRYSYNFAHLGVPIWNEADAGNPSMGYTSILWMTLNAIPALFTDQKDILILLAQVMAYLCFTLIIAVITNEIYILPIDSTWKFVALGAIFTTGYGRM